MLRRALPIPSNIDRITQAPPSILSDASRTSPLDLVPRANQVCLVDRVLDESNAPIRHQNVGPAGMVALAVREQRIIPDVTPALASVHVFHGASLLLGVMTVFIKPGPDATDNPSGRRH